MKNKIMRQRAYNVTEIAKIAGVSKATVSKALSDSNEISTETKKRILDIVQNDDSVISQRRRTQKNTAKAIGVGIPVTTSSRQRISHPFNMELLGSIGDTLNAHGYSMVLSQIPLWSELAVRQFFENSNAEGFIFIGQVVDEKRINMLAKEFGPLVVWGANLAGNSYITVGSDNTSAARNAVEHLINLGRKRIAFVGDARMPEAIDRLEGYKQAIKQADLHSTEELVIPTAGDRNQTQIEIKKQLNAGLKFDAVFTPNDTAAMNVIITLEDMGIHVPKDVAVVGFDDIDTASYFNPPLTTVRQDVIEGGHVLVEKVMRLINGEETQSEIIPTELIVRRSCGALSN